MAEIEIEFKKMLSEEDYEKIYNYYDFDNIPGITNTTYYYEDKCSSLKNNNAALRIRLNDKKSEITLKRQKEISNIEINEIWAGEDILENLDIEILPQKIKEELLVIGGVGRLKLSHQLKTIRKEKVLPQGLLVLDKTYFLGNIVDYELEFEVTNYEGGKMEFEKILEKFSLTNIPAKAKIARAVEYSKLYSQKKLREKIIEDYFNMWLNIDATNLANIFTEDVNYIESWGVEYKSLVNIITWFKDWNKTGYVLNWDIKQFIHSDNEQVFVEWYFKACVEGKLVCLDGMSLIKFDKNNKIYFLKEFACQADRIEVYKK